MSCLDIFSFSPHFFGLRSSLIASCVRYSEHQSWLSCGRRLFSANVPLTSSEAAEMHALRHRIEKLTKAQESSESVHRISKQILGGSSLNSVESLDTRIDELRKKINELVLSGADSEVLESLVRGLVASALKEGFERISSSSLMSLCEMCRELVAEKSAQFRVKVLQWVVENPDRLPDREYSVLLSGVLKSMDDVDGSRVDLDTRRTLLRLNERIGHALTAVCVFHIGRLCQIPAVAGMGLSGMTLRDMHRITRSTGDSLSGFDFSRAEILIPILDKLSGLYPVADLLSTSEYGSILRFLGDAKVRDVLGKSPELVGAASVAERHLSTLVTDGKCRPLVWIQFAASIVGLGVKIRDETASALVMRLTSTPLLYFSESTDSFSLSETRTHEALMEGGVARGLCDLILKSYPVRVRIRNCHSGRGSRDVFSRLLVALRKSQEEYKRVELASKGVDLVGSCQFLEVDSSESTFNAFRLCMDSLRVVAALDPGALKKRISREEAHRSDLWFDRSDSELDQYITSASEFLGSVLPRVSLEQFLRYDLAHGYTAASVLAAASIRASRLTQSAEARLSQSTEICLNVEPHSAFGKLCEFLSMTPIGTKYVPMRSLMSVLKVGPLSLRQTICSSISDRLALNGGMISSSDLIDVIVSGGVTSRDSVSRLTSLLFSDQRLPGLSRADAERAVLSLETNYGRLDELCVGPALEFLAQQQNTTELMESNSESFTRSREVSRVISNYLDRLRITV